jgi:raffinose/stachyose/melibiose transport system substrate-binding protein
MKGTWRRGGVALGAAVVMLLASACGDDGGGGDGGGEAQWWHIQTGEGEMPAVFTQILADFKAENPDANLVEEPITNDDFKPTLATQMQAGDPPDMFHTWGGGVLEQYVNAGLVKDLTEELPDLIASIDPAILAPYTVNDRVYGLPFDTGMIGIWYNKDLFAEAGLDPENPPTTWTDFLDTVQTLKDEGITPIAQAGQAPWTLHYWFSYLAVRIMGVDGYIAARDNKSFQETGFLEAAEEFKRLVDMEPFQDGFLTMGYGGEGSGPAVMGSGDAAMELMGQWGQDVQEDSSGQELGSEVIGWFPFPEVEGGAGAITDIYGGGNGHAIAADAPDYVVDFMEYFMTEGYPQMLETNPGIPVFSDMEIPAEQQNLITIAEAVSNATAVQLYFDQDLPVTVGNQVNTASAGIVDGSMTPEAAVQSMHDTFQAEPDFSVND